MRISHFTRKCVKNINQSVISDHLLTCDCKTNFDNFVILSNDFSNFNLLMKESLLVAFDNPILNKTVKLFPLELVEWKVIIRSSDTDFIICSNFIARFEKEACQAGYNVISIIFLSYFLTFFQSFFDVPFTVVQYCENSLYLHRSLN